MSIEIRFGDVWQSPDTGSRWRVTGLRLPSYAGRGAGQCGKVSVLRLDPPKWDDGAYVFAAEAFRSMTLISRED